MTREEFLVQLGQALAAARKAAGLIQGRGCRAGQCTPAGSVPFGLGVGCRALASTWIGECGRSRASGHISWNVLPRASACNRLCMP